MRICLALLAFAACAAVVSADEVFTDAADPKLPADFAVQGEYVGEAKDGQMYGCQVIALGNGAFQAVLYPGGLPGAGWDAKHKSLLAGKLEGDKANFKTAEGNRQYLAQSPEQFSATSKFPPDGQLTCEAQATGNDLVADIAGEKVELKKIERKSPTIGAAPPDGAILLFDGTPESMNQWRGGRLDEKTKLLNTDGSDILTNKKFNNYTMHLEFMLPYRPEARSQGRGNSGFYQVDHYEMQILDSFGLDGKHNECGGIYEKQPSLVNACLPPLVWQTYDVDFTNAVADNSGKKSNARITAKLNGILIHDDFEIPSVTGGARNEPEGTPGPIKLQGHGNPLQFRNVWIVEKK